MTQFNANKWIEDNNLESKDSWESYLLYCDRELNHQELNEVYNIMKEKEKLQSIGGAALDAEELSKFIDYAVEMFEDRQITFTVFMDYIDSIKEDAYYLSRKLRNMSPES